MAVGRVAFDVPRIHVAVEIGGKELQEARVHAHLNNINGFLLVLQISFFETCEIFIYNEKRRRQKAKTAIALTTANRARISTPWKTVQKCIMPRGPEHTMCAD